MPTPDVRRRLLARVVWHVVLATSALTMSFPVLWAALTSLKPANRVFSATPISDPTLDNYTRVMDGWPALSLLGNTFLMSAGVALGQLVIAVLAAFALVHLAPHRRRAVTALSVVALAVPPQAIVIPQFLLATRIGWQNTQLGLIVPQLGASALAVLLLVQYVQAIPPSLAEAARIEGARPREVLTHVVLPSLRPALLAVGILVFVTTWNEYLWPLLIAPRQEDATLQIGLSQFQTEGGTDFGALTAAATLASLPILLVYTTASRRITDAFLRSGFR